METLLSPRALSPPLNSKPSSTHQTKPTSHFLSLSKPTTFSGPKLLSSTRFSKPEPRDWLTDAKQGLAALALSLTLSFSPVGAALASEFNIINDGPPKDTYVVDDAGVLSRVTRSDLKKLLSDLEYRKKLRLNFITVRKLTSKADAFEYADQVLEKWYPSIEEGNNKGIVVLITSQKEGAITGGPAFIEAVGENILDATVSENLPVLATDEKYNEAVYSSAKRLVAAIDGLPDPGGPTVKDSKRESNFKTKEETAEKRGQFSLVVGGLLVIAFVVPMAQYFAYVSRK
ncbi:UPF0603 protein At1g54780, chloroplastic [Capsella rubella]|nr:UPF0603 protein At1g54780, chloroplastic [Capsella rubella]